jgi:mannose-1-phosphate guanylyltransferase
MSDSKKNLWALVLAAGEGRRLRRLTTTRSGLAIPKQFCSLDRGPSLMQEALERAAGVTDRERICVIVASQHRQWWSGQLGTVGPQNIIVQPRNRGTANGVLLPLLMILERDPRARVVLLPSDHHVSEERQLARALRCAATPPETDPADIVLLGLEPRAADTQLGYIVPNREAGRAYHRVERFVEKPDAAHAAALVYQGALWNTFIIAADASALLGLYEQRCPDIVAAMRAVVRGGRGGQVLEQALEELYRLLPELDFSSAILQRQEQHLRVLPVPECGWSDLGTPARVAEAVDALRRGDRAQSPDLGRHAIGQALLSLAAQHRQLQGAASASQ